ncbi:MAG: hypothetical protein KAG10_06935 [Methylococcales bacterium]|nr:hypothetical protein [Methylococcales bacterium]
MKKATFKDWNLDSLDAGFNLKQQLQAEFDLMPEWEILAKTMQLSDFETQTLSNLQQPLIWGGRAWNESELENKFISPLIMTAQFDNRQIGYFLERPLSGIIGDYELSGIVDGIIATGFRSPQMPYFCFHEYKRGIENQGSPDAQVLAAMLVAKELNQNKHPIYGLFVIGVDWNFVVLKDNQYCISKTYHADDEEIFTIFKMMKALKQIIQQVLIPT